jgi:hypothetical protein
MWQLKMRFENTTAMLWNCDNCDPVVCASRALFWHFAHVQKDNKLMIVFASDDAGQGTSNEDIS